MTSVKEQPRGDAEAFEFVDASWEIAQLYRADPMLLRFFEGLTQKRLLAGKVSGESQRVIFPPTSFCEVTYSKVDDLVEVGPDGIIRTFTVLPGPPQKLLVFVQLEGSSTASPGYLRGVAEDDMTSLDLVGAACRTVFAEAPVGDWSDFWFELQ